jgi:hypothetical protein
MSLMRRLKAKDAEGRPLTAKSRAESLDVTAVAISAAEAALGRNAARKRRKAKAAKAKTRSAR